jgi:hypothetical protein
MRYKHAPIFVLLLLPLLSGCQAGSSPLPVGTFINQTDPTEVLELRLDPSQTRNVLIRFSIETGANKYFGKSVGTYMLKTKHESSKGTFVYRVISWEGPLYRQSQRDDRRRQVWFTAENGDSWTLAVQVDGSLVDSSGVAWKRQIRG